MKRGGVKKLSFQRQIHALMGFWNCKFKQQLSVVNTAQKIKTRIIILTKEQRYMHMYIVWGKVE